MKTIAPPISIKFFTWHRPDRKLVAFVSDLPLSWLGRVWADACDVGLVVVGKYEKKIFVLSREEYEGGDLVAWHMREHTKDPQPWEMVVFND